MVLTSYWWLIIWLFAGGYLLNLIPKRHELLNEKEVERWDLLPAVGLILPYLIWAGTRTGVGDTELYRTLYLALEVDFTKIFEIFFSDTKDPGFTVLSMIMKSVLGNADVLFFLIIAAFQMISMALVFRRYSEDYWICIFLFIASTDFISWPLNGMRQFIAVCIIFACFKWMLEKKYVPLIIAIVLAAQLHGSAYLMLPIIFLVQGKAWNKKVLFALLAVLVCLPFMSELEPYINDFLQNTQYDDILQNEIWSADNGTNFLRVLVYSVPALLSLFGLRYVRKADDPVINICVNCSVMTMAMYLVSAVTSGIYIGRLPIYTTLQGYIAVPWLIDRIFEKKTAVFVKIAMIGLFLIFFYIQLNTWGMQ